LGGIDTLLINKIFIYFYLTSDGPSEMHVTWSTIDSTSPDLPMVEYGRRAISENIEKGTSVLFQAPGNMNLTQYIHRVTLKDLIPGQTYS
jgi:hypothetical protein